MADKPGLLIALGKPKGSGTDDESMPDPKETRRLAAQDMMAAMKSGDADAFADALDDFMAVGPMEE